MEDPWFIKYINSLPDDTIMIEITNTDMSNYELPSLMRFTKLQFLNLSENRLKKLPPLPPSLTYLDVSYNHLEELDIQHCDIGMLYIQYNKFHKIPIIPPLVTTLFMKECIKGLPHLTLAQYRKIEKIKELFFILKFSRRLERYYIKNIRNKKLNQELLYSPVFGFYKQFVNPKTLQMMNK